MNLLICFMVKKEKTCSLSVLLNISVSYLQIISILYLIIYSHCNSKLKRLHRNTELNTNVMCRVTQCQSACNVKQHYLKVQHTINTFRAKSTKGLTLSGQRARKD